MTPQNVEVVTRNLSGLDEPAKRMIIDMNQTHQRSWFNRHLDWAIRSGHSISVYPTDQPVTWVDNANRPVYEDRTRGTKRQMAGSNTQA